MPTKKTRYYSSIVLTRPGNDCHVTAGNYGNRAPAPTCSSAAMSSLSPWLWQMSRRFEQQHLKQMAWRQVRNGKNCEKKIAEVNPRHQNAALLSSYGMERQGLPTHVLARLPPLWPLQYSHWLPCMTTPTPSLTRDNIAPFFLSQQPDLQVELILGSVKLEKYCLPMPFPFSRLLL